LHSICHDLAINYDDDDDEDDDDDDDDDGDEYDGHEESDETVEGREHCIEFIRLFFS